MRQRQEEKKKERQRKKRRNKFICVENLCGIFYNIGVSLQWLTV
jgi:hypothetical protein